jgi:sec-independent protein translocase protein TatC
VGDGRTLTVTEHLEELRGRLIISIVALVVCSVLSFPFTDDFITFLAKPLRELETHAPEPEEIVDIQVGPDGVWRGDVPRSLAGRTLELDQAPMRLTVQSASGEPFTVVFGRPPEARAHYFNLMDPMYMRLKSALLLGLCVSLPLVLWQAWAFVAPGLTDSERSLAGPMLLLFIFSFPVGAAFAYLLLHFAVPALASFSFGDMVFLPDITKYIPFALTMLTIFGLAFEMPGVIWLMARAGLVSSAWLRHYRRHAMITMFVLAAIVTPPDVFTQVMLALPLVVLYEVSILLARSTERKPRKS